MGRLTRQKGFDILIEAMREVPQPWRLDIWGEGEARTLLQARITEAGLQDAIRLRGYSADPYHVLRSADLFVLSSRWEGLPTVLIEALACQCQIVATDCPRGPREILLDGALGALVPVEDANALARAVRTVDSGQQRVSASASLQRSRQFTATVSTMQWLSVLSKTAASG
jgi:glycosyltransferase involved in cell wall biosynthesis